MTLKGRHRKPNIATTIGTVCLGAGVVTSAWDMHWQWIVAGAGMFLILAGIGAYLDGRPT